MQKIQASIDDVEIDIAKNVVDKSMETRNKFKNEQDNEIKSTKGL